MGSFCGSNPQTVIQSASNPNVTNQQNQIYGTINDYAQRFAGDPSQLVAGWNQLQSTAAQGVADAATSNQPWINLGQGMVGQGSDTAGMSPSYYAAGAQNVAGVSPIQAQGWNPTPYESPFTNDVINSTMANIQQANAVQMNGALGNAIQSGNAFGGDRMGVTMSELARNQALASDQTIAALRQADFNQASQQAAAQQQYGLNLGQTNNAQQLQAGQTYGQLGQGLTQAGAAQGNLGTQLGQLGNLGMQGQLGAWQGLYNMGAGLQGTQQQMLSAPLTFGQWYANASPGTSAVPTSTTYPGSSPINTIVGLGLGAAGAGSMLSSLGPLMFGLSEGGRVDGYGEGGDVLPPDWRDAQPQSPQRPPTPEITPEMRRQMQDMFHGAPVGGLGGPAAARGLQHLLRPAEHQPPTNPKTPEEWYGFADGGNVDHPLVERYHQIRDGLLRRAGGGGAGDPGVQGAVGPGAPAQAYSMAEIGMGQPNIAQNPLVKNERLHHYLEEATDVSKGGPEARTAAIQNLDTPSALSGPPPAAAGGVIHKDPGGAAVGDAWTANSSDPGLGGAADPFDQHMQRGFDSLDKMLKLLGKRQGPQGPTTAPTAPNAPGNNLASLTANPGALAKLFNPTTTTDTLEPGIETAADGGRQYLEGGGEAYSPPRASSSDDPYGEFADYTRRSKEIMDQLGTQRPSPYMKMMDHPGWMALVAGARMMGTERDSLGLPLSAARRIGQGIEAGASYGQAQQKQDIGVRENALKHLDEMKRLALERARNPAIVNSLTGQGITAKLLEAEVARHNTVISQLNTLRMMAQRPGNKTAQQEWEYARQEEDRENKLHAANKERLAQDAAGAAQQGYGVGNASVRGQGTPPSTEPAAAPAPAPQAPQILPQGVPKGASFWDDQNPNNGGFGGFQPSSPGYITPPGITVQ